MNINEIKNKKWKISKKLVMNKWHTGTIITEEQECVFDILKQIGDEDSGKGILVDCSFQEYITKLSKCEYFELQEILYSNVGFIVEIKGTMSCKGLTIRSKIIKKKQLTEEQKEILRERFKRNIKKKDL